MVTREGSRPVRAEQGLRKLGFDLISLPPNIGMDLDEIGSCNGCGDETHGEDPTHTALAIVRFRACPLRAICAVFKTRWLTRASDQRPRFVNVAQRCRMTVG
jgi:hypothetical protein